MAYSVDENGNYKRTVRCGHCYEIGHNKSSCEKRKTQLRGNVERYTKELAENKFTDDWQRENAERWLANSKQQLESVTKKGMKRSCGFCQEVGHTRPTCSTRKTEVEEYARRLMIARTNIAEKLDCEGIFVGALIQAHDGEVPAIITRIALDEIALDNIVKEEHFVTRNTVYYEYIVPQPNSWGQTKTHGYCSLPNEVLNVKDVPEAQWYRNNSQRSFTVLSGVQVPSDAYDNAIDYKVVREFATEIIDPR